MQVELTQTQPNAVEHIHADVECRILLAQAQYHIRHIIHFDCVNSVLKSYVAQNYDFGTGT